MNSGEKTIMRFNKKQIIFHWMFAVSFFVLAITGLFLVIPGLSILASRGLSLLVHKIAAVMFMASVVLYYIFEREGLKRLVKDSFYFDKDDIDWLKKMIFYFLGKTKEMPPSGRLNGGEKLHHLSIVITFFTVSISGLFMWLGSGYLHPNLFLFMIIVHNISMFVMLCLTIGHIYFTFLYGALDHMISGYTTEKYAKKHIKWLNELKSKGMI